MPRLIGTHFGTYEVEWEAGRPRLAPFRLDRAPSPTGLAWLDLADHPDRIAASMVRAGWLEAVRAGDPERARERRGRDDFVPVEAAEAVGLMAAEIDRVRTAHGNSAIFGGSYGWASAGRFHHAQSQLKRFLNLAGGFTSSVNTYSYGTAGVLLPHVIGAPWKDAGVFTPSWDQIAAGAQHMIAFGGLRMSNAQVEAGGSGDHRAADWLARARAAGMRLTVVSPSRGDAPDGADWVPIRPNTDAAVLIAMCGVLLDEGLADLDFLASRTEGFETFARYLRGEDDGVRKTPAWAAAISGAPAQTIATLARDYATSRGLINLAWSLQRARFGEQPYWAAIALGAMAGRIGRPGQGVAFGLTAINSAGNPIRRLRGPSLGQGPNPVKDYIPVAAISELLTRPGETLDYNGVALTLPEIRLVQWAGGNPFHHHQDLNRLRQAFRRPETVIVHEHVWTATARHADIVFPAALAFERNDLAVSSRDNWLIANRQVLAPPPGVRTDHEFLAMAADRLGFGQAFTDGLSEMEWVERLYLGYREAYPELPAFGAFWEGGYAELDPGEEAPVPLNPLADFVRDPARAPLQTPSGRIEISSAAVAAFGYADCPGHPAWLEPEEWLGAPQARTYPFHLISPQPANRLHSQLDGAGPSQAAKVRGHEPMAINAADARDLGVEDGEIVEVFNARGACRVAARPTEALARGVLVIETGAWFDPQGPEGVDLGGNPNSLTADRRSSRLSQGPASNSALVAVRRVAF